MIISLLVTGYIFYLYFKLKAEREAIENSEFDSVAELKSAVIELNARVQGLEKRLTAPRK
jgi:hypothetical protein